MESSKITFKTQLSERSPYRTLIGTDYIDFLENNLSELYQGNIGLYWSREVEVENQKLYFPFIDIDTFLNKENNAESELITDSILRAKILIQSLSELSILSCFKFIATGGFGFRAVSNILLNKESYSGFVDLVKNELKSCIIDFQPTEVTTHPYQIFARKDNPFQNHRTLIGRHSVLVESDIIMGEFTSDDYRSVTGGELNPYYYIDAAKQLIDFRIVSDISSLGEFGHKIQRYGELRKSNAVDSINFFDISKNVKAISADKTLEMLNEHGYFFKEIDKATGKFYTFKNKICPACGYSNGNAYIKPPYFRLKCFRSSCPANITHGGLLLPEWSGLLLQKENNRSHRLLSAISTQKMTLADAQQSIKAHLNSNSDIFLRVTPGSGKTYLALEYACSQASLGKKIIYSTYNVAQVDEIYIVAKQILDGDDKIYRLHTQESFCRFKDNYQAVVRIGYSPSTLLCKCCQEKNTCEYYIERKQMHPGVYFVTHNMLSELNVEVFNADIIIIDESILPLALHDSENFTDADLRSLHAVVDNTHSHIINEILKTVTEIYSRKSSTYNQIILTKNYHETYHDNLLDLVSAKLGMESKELIAAIAEIVAKLKHKYNDLYTSRINFNVIRWLSGFLKDNVFSYVSFESNGIIKFCIKYVKKPLKFDGRYILLDATGSNIIVDKICNKPIPFVNIDIEWTCNSLFLEKTIKKSTDVEGVEILEIIKTGLSHFKQDKILLVSFKNNGEKLLNICRAIKPDIQFEFYNFFGQKGTNQFKGFGAIFVFGLPFPNINAAWQDAHILFPGVEQDGLRDSWAYVCMENELLQIVHRTRPVLKDNQPVELVVAGNCYPTSLPDPSQTISFKRREDPVGTAVARLRKFIDYFGFYDIILEYIAGVATTDSESKATQLRKSLFDKLGEVVAQYKAESLTAGPGYGGTEVTSTCPRSISSTYNLISLLLVQLQKLKIIDTEGEAQSSTIIYTIMGIDSAIDCNSMYFGNYQNDQFKVNKMKLTILKLFTLYFYLNETKWEVNLPMHFVHKNQARDFRTQLMDEFEYMDKYKITSPYSKFRKIDGIEIDSNGLYFYNAISELGLVDVQIAKSHAVNKSENFIDSEFNILIVYFVGNIVHVLSKDKFVTIESNVRIDRNLFQGCDCIVTNDGQACFELSEFENTTSIHDVMSVDKLLNNSKRYLKPHSVKNLLQKYNLELNRESEFKVCKIIFEVYQAQINLILSSKIIYIYQLECQVLHLHAIICRNGFNIDVDKLNGIIKVNGENCNNCTNIKKFNKILSEAALRDIFISEANLSETITGRIGFKTISKMDKKFRSIFKPKIGSVLLCFDIKCFEPTIVCSLSGDSYGLELINSEKDIYLEVASQISENLRDERLNNRWFGKVLFNIAINGGGEYALVSRCFESNLIIERQKAAEIFQYFEDMFPRIFQFQRAIIDKAIQHGKMCTKYNRMLLVDKEDKDSTIFNFVVQGSAADAFKRLLLKVNGLLTHPDEEILFHHYDAIYIQVPESGARNRMDKLKAAMEFSLSSDFGNVRFSVAASMRSSWAEEDTIVQV